MNIASPQEQFESRRRLDVLYGRKRPAIVLLPPRRATPVVRDWLLISTAYKPDISVDRILEVVSEVTGIPVIDILSERRGERVVLARHIAMYLARHLTKYAYPKLGKLFGGKDHATVLNATNRITALLETSRDAVDLVKSIRARLEGGN